MQSLLYNIVANSLSTTFFNDYACERCYNRYATKSRT